ncbi:MucBP domain-containing protein, partial [Enterococcus columbae]
AWQPATVTFETVISPVVSGYQVDKPNAGGLEATVEQPDVVDEVNYALKVVVVPTVQKGSVDVSYLDEKGQLLPGTVVELIKNQVPVGETYVVEVKAFTGYTFLKLAEDSAALQGKVENTVKHVRLVYQQLLTPEEESKPQLPNTGGNPQPTEPINEPVTKINKDIPVSQPVTVQPTQSTEKQARMTSRQLPKTGMEGINAAWGFICLALAGLFYKKAKRKND